MSPFQPEKVALEAGRIMLRRLDELLSNGENFAFETTLATKSYKNKIKVAKENGFKVILLFFWLRNLELAIECVKIRVKEGGHNIPEDVIRRRYVNGIKNLFEIYLPIVDEALVFDNSDVEPQLIMLKNFEDEVFIKNKLKFVSLKNSINIWNLIKEVQSKLKY